VSDVAIGSWERVALDADVYRIGADDRLQNGPS
jgi:hypothetical protein